MKLNRKPGVVWNVCPAIEESQEVIAGVFHEIAGAVAVVTSAKDSIHSQLSAHYQAPGDTRHAQAIDLRIRHLFAGDFARPEEWWPKVKVLARVLVETLNAQGKPGKWYVIVERDHLHIEWSDAAPNIRGYQPGLFVYVTDGVKAMGRIA